MLPKGQSSKRGNAYLAKPCGGPRPDGPRARSSLKAKRPDEPTRVPGRLALDVAEEVSGPSPLKTSTLKRGSGPKRSAGKRSKGTKDEIGEWRDAALHRSSIEVDGFEIPVDEVSGQLITSERAVVHHPIEAGDLNNAGIAQRLFPHEDRDGNVRMFPIVLHPDNSMVLGHSRHMLHHEPGVNAEPIPLAALRPETWALVLALDEGTGKQEWQSRMERDYA